MTKVFSIIAVAVLATTFVACGPSAEEKAKMEEQAKRQADSISAALSASLEGAMNEAAAPVDTTMAPATTETTTATDAHAH
jgi:PBP1b-binding outer membrane lipoprotein LpoB